MPLPRLPHQRALPLAYMSCRFHVAPTVMPAGNAVELSENRMPGDRPGLQLGEANEDRGGVGSHGQPHLPPRAGRDIDLLGQGHLGHHLCGLLIRGCSTRAVPPCGDRYHGGDPRTAAPL